MSFMWKLCRSANGLNSLIVSKTGKDGGYDGSIRQSGGKIGERGSVQEDSYFRKKNEIKLQKLKDRLKELSELEKNKRDKDDNPNRNNRY